MQGLNSQARPAHFDLGEGFADLMVRLNNEAPGELLLAARLVSQMTAEGHVCVDLNAFAGNASLLSVTGEERVAPELDAWVSVLRGTRVVGRPGDFRPLVLDEGNRLYLYRYWDYEQRLANSLLARAGAECGDVDDATLIDGLSRLYPGTNVHELDLQKIAAATALLKRFCVISGGPGTGKTTTVLRILALLIEQSHGEPLRIALAAPTGKAAARVAESIRDAKSKLDIGEDVLAAIPEEAKTLHRLLGYRTNSVTFRHNMDNPLPVDVVIVDEASMVDLALMTKLVEAVPDSARLILLGDKDQLASVEAGAVMADICGAVPGFSAAFAQRVRKITGFDLPVTQTLTSPLQDCAVSLVKSHRFGADSGIGKVAREVNSGDAQAALETLGGAYSDAALISYIGGPEDRAAFAARIKDGFRDYVNSVKRGAGVDEVFAAFNRFRVLCAVRKGGEGVVEVNRLAERCLAEIGLDTGIDTWYVGRPVMVTRNDYNLMLFNGDVGIVLPDPEAGGDLRAYFPLGGSGEFRRVHPSRLAEYETVYAMTVHKSQGSEFDHVLLLLPTVESKVLGRELIYTALSRARHNVEVWGTPEIVGSAVSQCEKRSSGLYDRLWPATRSSEG